MSIHKFFNGFDHSDITELQKNQQIFQGKLQDISGNFTDLSGDVTGISGNIAELSNSFTGMSKTVTELSGEVTGALDAAETASDVAEAASKTAETASNTAGAALDQVTELSATLAETLGDSDKIMATCIVASAVAVTAITCLAAFFIYQGIKCEKEKNSSSDKKPNRNLNILFAEEVGTGMQQGIPQN